MIKFCENYAIGTGPNGQRHVRSLQDQSTFYSISAFLTAEWIYCADKTALLKRLDRVEAKLSTDEVRA